MLARYELRSMLGMVVVVVGELTVVTFGGAV